MNNHLIQSGETLTGISKKYGVSVDSLVQANKIADPNKIQAGASLSIPKLAKAPAPTNTMQTTEGQRNIDQGVANKFDQYATDRGLSSANSVQTGNATQTQQQTGAQMSQTGTGTTTLPQATQTTTTGATTSPDGSQATPATKATAPVKSPYDVNEGDAPELASAKTQFKQTMQTLDTQIADLNTTLSEMKARAPAEQQVVMDQIASKFNLAKAKLAESHTQQMKRHEKMLMQSGGRYTPMQTEGLLTAEANRNIVELATLDSQQAIEEMNAVQARKKEDWDTLKGKMDMLNTIQDNKAAALTSLNSIATKIMANQTNLEKIAQKEEQYGFSDPAKLASAIAPNLIEQIKGMTPAQMDIFLEGKAKEYGMINTDILKSAIISESSASVLDDAKLENLKTRTAKTAQTKAKASSTKKPTATKAKLDDINTVISDFQAQMKAKGWKGANPDAYAYYKAEIMKQHGSAGVAELEKQMKALGIIVDKTK